MTNISVENGTFREPTQNLHENVFVRKNVNIPRQEVSQMFEKIFKYQHEKDKVDWNLPPVTELFKEYYQLDTLQQLRVRLNAVKSKLNNYIIEDWSVHTRRKDPSGEIPWRLKNETKAEFVTVAWCKFFECLHRFPLVTNPKLNTLHLCEAPGAFIAALNHYLYSTFESEEIEWKWLSTTLNPYYEGNPWTKMISDDRFMLYTLNNWLFHGDFTGNIMKRSNIEHMQQECKTRLGDNIHLITADGSIDCVETPDCQEEVVAHLHFAEITAALNILSNGGCFVIKMFTFFESNTVSELFLLHCIFQEVNIFKPATSKRGNSEVYVICLQYKKDTTHLAELLEIMKSKVDEGQQGKCILPIFSKAQLPSNFLQQNEICARFFMVQQIRAIEINISTFESKLRHNTRRNHQLRSLVTEEYYRRYSVQSIEEKHTILYEKHGIIEAGSKTCLHRGSFSERALLKDTGIDEQIFKLCGILNDLEKSMLGCYDILLDEEELADGFKVDLKYYNGSPYAKLECSLFVAVPVLQLRQKLQNIFYIDPLHQLVSECQLDGRNIFLDPNTDNSSSTEDYFETQRIFMINILSAIITDKPQRIKFINFPFLSHFSVSILRFLSANFFKNLLITTEPNFTIILSNFKNTSSHIQELDHLYHTIKESSQILCFCNIEHLHRNEFSRALTEFNNLLLLKNCRMLLQY